MVRRRHHLARPDRRGGALIVSLLAVTAVVGLAAAAFTLSLAQSREVERVSTEVRSLYLAEAGITDCMAQIAVAESNGAVVPANWGTQQNPIEQGSGRYWADMTDNGDGTYTVQSTGATAFGRFTLEALVGPVGGSVFDHAIFAGNSAGDPAYTMRLSGLGGQADSVTGDIYSGGDIELDGDAALVGDAFAGGVVTGMPGHDNVSRPIPDIAGMNYEANHDYDVASLFSSASWTWDNTGGTAWQLPESSPAHIFRKNPSDRTDEINGTVKDDYFLEDPYESLSSFTAPNGKKGQPITLSGTMGAPGSNSTDKVYYIDGNLWVHNKPIGRFLMDNSDAEGFKVTFVVKGNVYFSDDIYLGDEDKDGVAFIAIEDEGVADSGNIYLGDPRYGTVEYLNTFLYAENTFYDLNLSASGSKQVEIRGNMTAGDQVDIQRDYVKADGSIEHSKLTVDFDDRISTGALELPGLPTVDNGIAGFAVRSWRRVTP